MAQETPLQLAVNEVLRSFNVQALKHSGLTYKLHIYKQNKFGVAKGTTAEDLQNIKDIKKKKLGEVGILRLLQIKDEEIIIIHEIKIDIDKKKSPNTYIQDLMRMFLQDCIGTYCIISTSQKGGINNNKSQPVINEKTEELVEETK